MYSWRITKYNPKYRNENGAYQKDEWTSISDIGKYFDDTILEKEEYLKVETKYVDAVNRFLNYLEVNDLIATELVKYEGTYAGHFGEADASLKSTYKLLTATQPLSKEDTSNIIRLALREELHCKLQSKTGDFKVHFGYDYYMYIMSEKDCQTVLNETDLFVEPFQSPYETY